MTHPSPKINITLTQMPHPPGTRWALVIVWGLMSCQSFYCLGHTPTVTSLRFEAAFTVVDGDISGLNLLTAGVVVALNTLASQVGPSTFPTAEQFFLAFFNLIYILSFSIFLSHLSHLLFMLSRSFVRFCLLLDCPFWCFLGETTQSHCQTSSWPSLFSTQPSIL